VLYRRAEPKRSKLNRPPPDHRGTQKKSGERLAPPARTLDGC